MKWCRGQKQNRVPGPPTKSAHCRVYNVLSAFVCLCVFSFMMKKKRASLCQKGQIMAATGFAVTCGFMWTRAHCNEHRLSDRLRRTRAESYHLAVVPRLSCNFVAFSHKHSLFLQSKSKGAETVRPARDMSVWLMCSCVGALSSPLCLWPASPILQAKTLSISSHYSVTWNHGAKKPHHLLHLLNESNFLPESPGPAHASIATLNYLTLIQINKSHHDQDCTIPRRHADRASISPCADNNSSYTPKSRVNYLVYISTKIQSRKGRLVSVPLHYEIYTLCYENIHIIDSALWHPLIPVLH